MKSKRDILIMIDTWANSSIKKKCCCGVRLYLEHEQRERVGERAAAAEEVAVVDLGLVVARAEELGEQSRT